MWLSNDPVPRSSTLRACLTAPPSRQCTRWAPRSAPEQSTVHASAKRALLTVCFRAHRHVGARLCPACWTATMEQSSRMARRCVHRLCACAADIVTQRRPPALRFVRPAQGSGKTYTMTGAPRHTPGTAEGLLPAAKAQCPEHTGSHLSARLLLCCRYRRVGRR